MKRRIAVEGVSNFRDIEGWITRNEGIVRARIISGIQIHQLPIPSAEYSRSVVIEEPQCYTKGPEGHEQDYMTFLESGANAFRTVMEHIASNPYDPILVFSAQGKDQVGIFIMLLLMVAGVDPESISGEYAIGLGTSAAINKNVYENSESTQNTGGMLIHDKSARFNSTPYESMHHNINAFWKKYGKVERYLSEICGMGPDTVKRVRENVVEIVDPAEIKAKL
ncbi:uncharacterized protein VTP21DRAFT_10715 [Calcarisporiella thermophila]|uniref:uncharacterized protein n=1 Tax=Calcarisporiella thermophila TaxID=911321 RepID=UPI003743366D